MEVKKQHWWEGYPWRMVQCNLREIDMEDMDAAVYAQKLSDFGATVTLLNAAGILASYDTELEFQTRSSFLHGDDLGKIIEECHKRGIRVIARTDFSKVRYDLYRQHPEWAYVRADGEIVNYNGDVHVCPNSEYQQEKMFDILTEALTKYPFDGVFCNMSGFLVVDYSGNYHGSCHCENCRTKFRQMFGAEIPERDDPKNPDYIKYMGFKARCTAEHTRRLREHIKSINPELAVNGVDFARTESATEIDVPQWVYSGSSNTRKTIGNGKPLIADNESVDFMGFRYRDISVSPHQMALRQWQLLANGGNTSVYIMGHLGNHGDRSWYEPTRQVFAFHKEHEALYTGLRPCARTAILHKGLMGRNDPEVYGWIRALTESHIPFLEMNLKEVKGIEDLKGIHTLILGDCRVLSEEQAAIFDLFAERGGTLLVTGDTGMMTPTMEKRTQMPLKALGVQNMAEKRSGLMSTMLEILPRDREVFSESRETPYIAIGGELYQAESEPGAVTYTRVIGEHPFGPPERCYFTGEAETDIPGVIVNSYGEGQGIYVPWMIGSFYFKEGYLNTLHFMRDILYGLAGLCSLAPALTPMVELCISENEDCRVIHLINNTGFFGNTFFAPVPVRDIVLEPGNEWDMGTAAAKAGRNIRTLRGGKVSVEETNQEIRIVLDRLMDYEAIVIGK
ncbi:MAG: beta-galactosidase [Blautia sp.]|nr:beta-galactosidase [Blautia sp.]